MEPEGRARGQPRNNQSRGGGPGQHNQGRGGGGGHQNQGRGGGQQNQGRGGGHQNQGRGGGQPNQGRGGGGGPHNQGRGGGGGPGANNQGGRGGSGPVPTPTPTQASAWGAPVASAWGAKAATGPGGGGGPVPSPTPAPASAWGAPAATGPPAQGRLGSGPNQSAPAAAGGGGDGTGPGSNPQGRAAAGPGPNVQGRVGSGPGPSGRGGAAGGSAGSVTSGGGDGAHQQRPASSASSSGPRGDGSRPPTTGMRDGASRGSVRDQRLLEDIVLTRPSNIKSKRGIAGKPVELSTNYFKLKRAPTWNLYQYRVDFNPEIEHDGIRKRLMFEQKPNIGGYLFDGTMLFLTKKLDQEVTEIMTKDREENPIQILLKFVGIVSMNTARSLQVLNIILRRSMEGLKLQLVGRNLFDAVAKIDIREYNLQLWPGYITSIRQHEQDLLLCAELSFKVMRTETVYNIMQTTYQNSRNFKEAFNMQMLGTVVLTDYNNRTYRVDEVKYDLSPLSTFATRDGETNFVDYYKKRYGLTIRDVKQPLISSMVKEKDIRGNCSQQEVLLIPELCRATGMTDQMKSNFHLMSAVAQYTRLGPSDRIKKLLDFNRRLQTTPDSMKVLNEWSMSLEHQMVELVGRKLDSESVVFGNNRKTVVNLSADWTRELQNASMFKSIPLLRWVVIFPQSCTSETMRFLENIRNAAQGLKFALSKPEFLKLPDDRIQTYSTNIDRAMSMDPQMLVIVVPNQNVDKYSNIKKKCCVERPIPSQVLCLRTMRCKPGKESSLLSVATKVVIQMNCKLGGTPWMTEIPGNNIMVIGFDVCHDTTDKSKSYGAMVATMDMKKSSNFFSAVSAHRNGEELSDHFALNVCKAIKQYHTEHGSLPDRILIYRDGVGEGQTDYVYQHETKVLISRLNEVYKKAGNLTYRLAFTIVSKRINSRFFKKGGMNPDPGTVIDDVVTLPERYDFFLVSQSCRVGTVSPTSYNIIYDTTGLSPNQHQLFAYKMTHLYFNWSGTLRVPAVCQYAHKLAFLVGQFIHQSPAAALEKQLYFL